MVVPESRGDENICGFLSLRSLRDISLYPQMWQKKQAFRNLFLYESLFDPEPKFKRCVSFPYLHLTYFGLTIIMFSLFIFLVYFVMYTDINSDKNSV